MKQAEYKQLVESLEGLTDEQYDAICPRASNITQLCALNFTQGR
jgi:hypothetical protein